MVKNKQIEIDFIEVFDRGILGIPEAIKLDNNTTMRLYCRYKNISMKENNIRLDNIIKVFLPFDYEKAMEVLEEGITFNGKKYVSLMTSPSMMKKEQNKKFKCEYLFIAEEDKEFLEILENCLSLNKIDKIKKSKEVCITKDYVARMGLALSGSKGINYKPNIVILPSDNYKYIADYVTFKNGQLVDLNRDEVESNKELGVHEFADGCGFMSERLAKEIQTQLEVKYPVDFAIIRMYNGTATKGLVIKADWKKYFEENYTKTDYFYKDENGDFITKDYFGNMVNISRADLILNTNMCKFAKLWKDEEFTDINEAIAEAMKVENIRDYADILNKIYVTKINKEQPKKYTQLSYQVLANVALLPKEMEELSRESVDYMRSICNLRKDKFDEARLMCYMGDYINQDDEEYESERLLSASTKVHEMLQINTNFAVVGYIRNILLNNIRKTVHQVAGGKFWCKGGYKYSFIDPICFLNWVMTRDIPSSRELGEREYYVPNETGNRVMTRNPLASYSEVHRATLVKNEKLDKYFGHLTNELIFFNQKDDTFFISSGEDADGDANGIWENDILYNAVVEPMDNRHFYNISDGQDKKVKFTDKDKYECIIKASGNLIGSIADISTKISNKATELGYYSVKKETVRTFNDIKETLIKNNEEYKELDEKVKKYKSEIEQIEEDGVIWTETDWAGESVDVTIVKLKDFKRLLKAAKKELNDKVIEKIEELIKEKKIVRVENLEPKKAREIIINQFYSLREDTYYSLYLSQKAIDASKSCVFPSEEEVAKLDKYKKMLFPRFVYYTNYSTNKSNPKYKHYKRCKYTHNAMNINCNKIALDLIKGEMKARFNSDDEVYFEKLNDNPTNLVKFFREANTEENESVYSLVKDLLNEYKKEREEARRDYRDIKEERNKKLNEIDYKYLLLSEVAIENNEKFEIAMALAKLLEEKLVNTEHVLKLFWLVYEAVRDIKERPTYEYVEDENGEYDWLWTRYKKQEVDMDDNKHHDKDKDKIVNKIANVSFNINVTNKEAQITDKLITINRQTESKKGLINQIALVNSEGVEIGYIYNNSAKRIKGNEKVFEDELMAIKEIEVIDHKCELNKKGNPVDTLKVIF